MQATRTRPALRRGGIVYLSTEDIVPNPVQPRKLFDDEGLEELSRSIKDYGILNPLSVRLRGSRYELVAGERRLRAARLAGLKEVPCILLDVNMEDASLIALVENLQRRDLDFIEEANGINQLIRMFGMSQEEAARRIGKSQSAVANKLRLLKLPREVLEILRDGGATERHARALLCLEDAQLQLQAAQTVVEQHLTVAQTEALTETLLLPPPPDQPARRPRRTFVVKDVRLFLNTVQRGLTLMRTAGVNAQCQREDGEEEILLTIRIPRSPARG